MKKLRHPHFVEIVGSYTDPLYIAYLMLPIAEYNLKQFLARKLQPTDLVSLRYFFGCLAGAMEYLHSQKIRHRDLKPENILVHDSSVYVADFGSVLDGSLNGHTTTQDLHTAVTKFYMAPEVAHSIPRKRSADMWSLGVIFLEMCTAMSGTSPSLFRDHIERYSRAANQPGYAYANPHALTKWMDRIRNHNLKSYIAEDNEALSWTIGLLKTKPSERTSAILLLRDIKDSGFEDRFCCAECKARSQAVLSGYNDQDQASAHGEQEQREASYREEVAALLPTPEKRPSLNTEKSYSITTWLQDLPPASETAYGAIIPRPITGPTSQFLEEPHPFVSSPSSTRWHSAEASIVSQESPGTPDLGFFVDEEPSTDGGNQPHDPFDCIIDTSGSETSALPDDVFPAVGDTDMGIAFDLTAIEEEEGVSESEEERSLEQLMVPWTSDDGFYKPTFTSNLVSRIGDPVLEQSAETGLPLVKKLPDEIKQELAMDRMESSKEYEIHDLIHRPEGQSHVKDADHLPKRLGLETSVDRPPDDSSESKLRGGSSSRQRSSFESRVPPGEYVASDLSLVASTASEKRQIAPGLLDGIRRAFTEALPQVSKSNKSDLPKLSEKNVTFVAAENEPTEKTDGTTRELKRLDLVNPADYINTAWRTMDTPKGPPSSVLSNATRTKLRGGNITMMDRSFNLLGTYCRAGKSAAVKEMIRRGLNVKHRPGALQSAIRGASMKHVRCVRELVSHGAKVNFVSQRSGKTPLHWAIENPPFEGFDTLVGILLLGGADINQRDSFGNPPLISILSLGGGRGTPLQQYQIDTVALFLSEKIPDVIDLDAVQIGTSNTALHLAVRRRNPTVVALLVFKGADVNARNASGITPLLMAANQWQSASNRTVEQDLMLEYLLQSDKLDVDAKGGSLERTALHQAVAAGYVWAVGELVGRGASLELQDNKGSDAIAIAQSVQELMGGNEFEEIMNIIDPPRRKKGK